MVYFTDHRRFEITNIVHRKLWDHRNIAIPIVLHRNTASKKESTPQHRKPPCPPLYGTTFLKQNSTNSMFATLHLNHNFFWNINVGRGFHIPWTTQMECPS